jgi:ribosomal protein S6
MLKLVSQMTYNLTLVLRSTLKDADRKKLVDSVKDGFGKAKVTEKEVSGYFVSMIAEPEEVLKADFEKRLFNNNDVLRHLLLRTK